MNKRAHQANKPDRQTCCQPAVQIGDRDVSKLSRHWISGTIQTPVGQVPVVTTRLLSSDKIGSYKARWGVGRMASRVEPGLYAVGRPTDKSPVLVSANYKMSFDRLRSCLNGTDSWILVINTHGINVWCAAGKGTFGTDEIVARVRSVRLSEVVSHRKLILPQLGAAGVAAHEVKKYSGFRVRYGPIRARDIQAFLEADMKTTPEMRQVRFGIRERIVLIPAELVLSAKYALCAAVCFMLLSGLGPGVYSLDRIAEYGMASGLLILLAYVAGTTVPPALLPWLPGRSFSIKGVWVGIILAAGIWWYASHSPETFRNQWSVAGWLVIVPVVSSFLAMNFTGSSTYTSLSGVLKEMRVALPIQICCAVIGVGLWTIGLFV